jgi:hypothetical protein
MKSKTPKRKSSAGKAAKAAKKKKPAKVKASAKSKSRGKAKAAGKRPAAAKRMAPKKKVAAKKPAAKKKSAAPSRKPVAPAMAAAPPAIVETWAPADEGSDAAVWKDGGDDENTSVDRKPMGAVPDAGAEEDDEGGDEINHAPAADDAREES